MKDQYIDEITPPYSKFIAFDYYDGPLTGFLSTGDKKEFYYKIIWWDEEQISRAYVVVPCNKGTLDRVVTLLRPHMTISEPELYVKTWPSKLGGRQRLEHSLQECVPRMEDFIAVVISSNFPLSIDRIVREPDRGYKKWKKRLAQLSGLGGLGLVSDPSSL